MWIFALILPLFVLVGSAVIAILCDERRPLVLLCLGGMVGMIATSIALSLLGLLFGIVVATWLVLALLLLGGLAAIVYWWRSRLWQAGRDVSWKYVFLLLVLAMHFGVVAAVSWQYAIGPGVEIDNLIAYSTFPSSIARGNYPVVNPYQPDQLLAYRLPYHVLGAFASRLANQAAPVVLTLLNAALFTFLFLGAVGMGLASRFGPWQTMLAGALFLTVGDFQWLLLSQLSSLEYTDFNQHTLVTAYLRDTIGLALANSVKNASLTYGHLVVFCWLTLYIYASGTVGWRRTALPLATGVVLGHLAAAGETWLAALTAALLVDLAIRLVMSRQASYESMLRFAGAAVAFITTAVLSPGILFARLFGGIVSDPGIQFKGWHILHYRTARLDSKGQFLNAEVWTPLLQPEFAWLWGLIVFAAPLALLFTWRTRFHLPRLTILYSGACFSAFFLFTVDHAVDMWRFVYSGTAALGFVAGLAVIWLLSSIRLESSLVKCTALFALLFAGVLYMGGFVQYSLAVPWLADSRPPQLYRQDVEAVKVFLNRETEVQERLLVLGNAPHWYFPLLSSSQAERATFAVYVLAYSGQHFPTGYLFAERVGPSVNSTQLLRAEVAQGKLSAVDLQALDIIYLYASEPWLTNLHRAALAEKLARGSLARVWRAQDMGPPHACRAFLRLDETARTSVTAVTFAEGNNVAVPRTPLQLPLSRVRPAGAGNRSSSAEQSKVQASVLITVSEPSTVVVASGDAFSMRIAVADALALRTPPLDTDSVLTVRTTAGSAQVLWLEVYAPLAPQAASFIPDHLDLCGAAGVSSGTAAGV